MKFLIRASHLIFLILFILSLIFYLERVAFIDSAYHIFKLINAESLTYEAGRYGAFLTKWPVVLLVNLGAPLKVILLVFSGWFVIWYYLIFLMISYPLKNKKIGVALALSLVTGYGNTFFHCVTETHQALVYSFLFYAWISSTIKLTSLLRIVGGILLILLSFLTHPISLLVILTLLGFYLMQNKNYLTSTSYVYPVFIAVLVILKLLFTESDSYEGHFFDLKDILASFHSRMSNWVFYFRNITFLYLTSTLALILLAFNMYKRKTFVHFYTFFSSIMLLFLLILFYKGGANMMKERALLPFCSVVVFFLVEVLSKKTLDKNYTKSYFIFSSVIGLAVIISMRIEHATIQNKYLLAFNNEIFNSTKKIIVPLNEINDNKNAITWAIPYETLLLSSASGKENSKTIYPLRSQELNSINLNDNNLLLGAPFYLKHSASRLNKNYFILDQSSYIKLKSFPK
jgi:hypothetical protein